MTAPKYEGPARWPFVAEMCPAFTQIIIIRLNQWLACDVTVVRGISATVITGLPDEPLKLNLLQSKVAPLFHIEAVIELWFTGDCAIANSCSNATLILIRWIGRKREEIEWLQLRDQFFISGVAEYEPQKKMAFCFSDQLNMTQLKWQPLSLQHVFRARSMSAFHLSKPGATRSACR